MIKKFKTSRVHSLFIPMFILALFSTIAYAATKPAVSSKYVTVTVDVEKNGKIISMPTALTSYGEKASMLIQGDIEEGQEILYLEVVAIEKNKKTVSLTGLSCVGRNSNSVNPLRLYRRSERMALCKQHKDKFSIDVRYDKPSVLRSSDDGFKYTFRVEEGAHTERFHERSPSKKSK